MKFKWTKIKQDSFKEIKPLVAHNTLLDYPVFNQECKIHTNVSNLQLWAVIGQKGKPKAFYSRKLTFFQEKVYSKIKKGAKQHWNSKEI